MKVLQIVFISGPLTYLDETVTYLNNLFIFLIAEHSTRAPSRLDFRELAQLPWLKISELA